MMVKKRFSGQTLAIIILAILLVLAIAFGGVYAFYSERTNQITGQIKLANLEIALDSATGESGKSEIIIYNKEDIVPGQKLTNTPLVIRNLSSFNVYLIVVYQIKAEKRDETKEKVEDEFINPVLGLGTEYINPLHPNVKRDKFPNKAWIDYVFDDGEGNIYRCLVSSVSHPKSTDEGVVVIGKDSLALAPEMGNEYLYTEISLTFQAFAIAAPGLEITESTTSQEKCEIIVEKIYKSQGSEFLNFV